MRENLKAFLAKVSADALLIERLKAAKEYDEILALAKEIGVELTLADIEPENSELSEEELNVVSGGKSGGCFCVLAGGGGGKNGRDDVYGCPVWPMVRAATEAKMISPASAPWAARV